MSNWSAVGGVVVAYFGFHSLRWRQSFIHRVLWLMQLIVARSFKSGCGGFSRKKFYPSRTHAHSWFGGGFVQTLTPPPPKINRRIFWLTVQRGAPTYQHREISATLRHVWAMASPTPPWYPVFDQSKAGARQALRFNTRAKVQHHCTALYWRRLQFSRCREMPMQMVVFAALGSFVMPAWNCWFRNVLQVTCQRRKRCKRVELKGVSSDCKIRLVAAGLQQIN